MKNGMNLRKCEKNSILFSELTLHSNHSYLWLFNIDRVANGV